MEEIVLQRTLRSKTFDKGDGSFSLHSHVKPIHYVDDADDFQEIELVLEDKGTYWEMTRNNYQLRVIKDFSANWLILYRNRFKNFSLNEKAFHTIKFEPKMLAWVNATDLSDMQVFRNQQAVQGDYDSTKNVVRWTNAFGDGIHFELTLNRLSFSKEIVIDAKNKLELPPTANHKLVALFKYDGVKQDAVSRLRIRDDADKTEWDEDSYKEGVDGYEIGEDDNHRSFIRPAYIRDSNSNSPSGSAQKIKVFWKKYNGFLWQAKVLPTAFLKNATYPVRADTVTTVYPDADTETDTVDMTMYGNWSADWATARGFIATAGTYTGDTQTFNPGGYGIGTRYANVGGMKYIYARYKMVVKYNIPAGSTITAAKVSLVLQYNAEYYDNDAQAYTTCVIHSRTTGSQTAYTSQDSNISYFGGSKICNDNLLSNTPTAGSRYDWTFNSTGLAAITANGSNQFLHIGMLEGHDYENTPVAADSDSICNRMAEYAGTASDPYLEITYTTSSGLTVDTSDSVAISENVAVSVTRTVSVSDSVAISENISRVRSSFVNVSDSIAISENRTFLVNRTPNVFDAVTISESVSKLSSSCLASVFDAVAISENITLAGIGSGVTKVYRTIKQWASQEQANKNDLNKLFSQLNFGDLATSWSFPITDGTVNMDGSNTFAGFASKVGSVYTLTRNVYATTLTIGGGVTLKTDGFLIFAQTITGTGTLEAPTGTNGTDGGGTDNSGGAGGASSGSGVLKSTAGGNGANGHFSFAYLCNNPSISGLNTIYVGSDGSSGGQSNNCAGFPGTLPSDLFCSRYFVFPFCCFGYVWDYNTNAFVAMKPAGASMGGAGCTDANYTHGYHPSGGGAGSSGGTVIVNCQTWSGSFTIKSVGGNGGGGASSHGLTSGGGGGGAGGVSIFFYVTKTWSGSYTLTGGTAGQPGTYPYNYGGTAGGTGATGVYFEIPFTDLLR